jgi:hypothetical protein
LHIPARQVTLPRGSFWQGELTTNVDNCQLFQFSFSTDNIHDHVTTFVMAGEDLLMILTTLGEDLLATLMTAGDYLVETHDDDTDNPCDNADL